MELAILSDELSLDLDEALAAGAELGFRKYEIRCIDSYEQRVPYFADGREERLQRAREKNGLSYTALTPGVFKIKPSETEALRRELDHTLPKTCAMAQRLGAPRVIVFGFMRGPGESYEDALSHLRAAAQIAQDHGLELSVENEPGSFCDTGFNTAAAIRSIDLPHAGINWDPANAVISGEAAYPSGYDAIKPHLQNLHIKDSIPLPDGKWENHLIGDGGVNWLGHLAALLRDRPLSHLTLETHVFPVLDATREDLRRLKHLFHAAEQINAESLYTQ